MTYFVFLLLFICGLLIASNISLSFSILEYLGYAFPLSFGLWSFMLTGMDFIGLPLNNRFLLIGILLLWIGLLMARLVLKKGVSLGSFKTYISESWQSSQSTIMGFVKKPLSINFAYIAIMGIATFVIVALALKAVYWPVINYDSLSGFDLLAKLIAEEGTLNNSVFSKENPMYSIRSSYPPLTVHALAITYLFGTVNSKIISVIFLFSVVLSLYAFIKKENNHYLAAIGLFLLCATPDFMAFNAMASSNTICALYVFIGLASFDKWFHESDKAYLVLGTIGLALAIWTRSESIIFAFVAGLFLLYKVWKDKSYKVLIFYTLSTLLPLIIWQLYLKFGIAINSSQPVITHLYWDGQKFSDMMRQINFVLFQKQIFSYTVRIIIFFMLLNLVFVFKNKRAIPLTVLIVSSFLFYIFVYYQMDTDYTTYSKGGWIGSGFKRGIFYFIPIGCYYVANSFVMKKLFGNAV